jgi:UDPglucose--hexose-1-phosphate uridylyltransferase
MPTTIYAHIQRLLDYGIGHNLLKTDDIIYSRNRILSLLKLHEWQSPHEDVETEVPELYQILDSMVDWARRFGDITLETNAEREVFDTEIMDCMMPRPSEVIRDFYSRYREDPIAATNEYYQMSIASNYIRTNRISKNKKWKSNTPYGEIDITINLSKPEKDPKEIAFEKRAQAVSYPTCLLCIENEGYKGHLKHPARANHRIIPIQLNKEEWFFQYSPYVYYNEHSIIFNKHHVPMKISELTFQRLLDFIDKFPHYFLGSNADLPIVGGSILSHDHFQGGQYEFALERAQMEETMRLAAFPSVTTGIVKWPMSVIRVRGSKDEVKAVTALIWRNWLDYSDLDSNVISHSGQIPHNTVTPIARRRGDLFEVDIVLRNNRTTEEYPDGIFHPHQELHHIKKENIGLIEVMGLAVLPGRLATELEKMGHYLINPTEKSNWDQEMLKHYHWHLDILEKYNDINYDNVSNVLEIEVAAKFHTVLEHAGVFKRTAEGKQSFLRFLQRINDSGSM